MDDAGPRLRALLQIEDPIVRLVAADRMAQQLRVLVTELATEAHDAGYSSEQRALGVCRATAHERFITGNSPAKRRTRRAR
ncbi:MAG: hypothetical protein M3P34_08600 [Actinomycetota bacterium]|nr:hypothetical protein [Actinomycetota bacterium]